MARKQNVQTLPRVKRFVSKFVLSTYTYSAIFITIGSLFVYQIIGVALFSGTSYASVSPNVTTVAATNIAQTGAALNLRTGDVGNVSSSTYSFEYGPTTAYGSTVNATNPVYNIEILSAVGLSSSGWTGTLRSIYGGVKDSLGNIYVASWEYDDSACKVLKFDPSGNFLYQLGGSCVQNSPTELYRVRSAMAIDSADNLYISQFDSQYILKYSSTGTLLSAIDMASPSSVTSLAVNKMDDSLYVAGNSIMKFNSSGVQDAGFDSSDIANIGAQYIATNSYGEIYARPGVGCTALKRYSSAGVLIDELSLPPENSVRCSNLLFVDANDRVYISGSDTAFNVSDQPHIFIYNRAGTLLGRFWENWGGPATFNRILSADPTTGSLSLLADPGFDGNNVYEIGSKRLANLSGLTCGTTYHYRAVATSGSSTAYGLDQTFTTSACPPSYEITTSSLPAGVVGQSYSYKITTSYTPAFGVTWNDITGGSLPPGLELDQYSSQRGTISGTPTTAGSYTFTVNVDWGAPASKQFTIVITDPAPLLEITTTELDEGEVGVTYEQAIGTNNEDATLSLASGSLPPGLQLAADGAIIGTPTRAGTFNFVARATAGSEQVTQALQIVVTSPQVGQEDEDVAVTGSMKIITQGLPNGFVGKDYLTQIEFEADGSPLVDIVDGSLPPGLKMSTIGTIGGTPSSQGRYEFMVRVSDGVHADQRVYQITILDDQQLAQASTNNPIKNQSQSAAPSSNLFAFARQIPAPIAFGLPWSLLLLALILVGSQYYSLHSESVAIRRIQHRLNQQERLVDEQNNFVALSTHYLHTPLTVMEGEISLMVKAGTISQSEATKLRAALTDINAQAEKILNDSTGNSDTE